MNIAIILGGVNVFASTAVLLSLLFKMKKLRLELSAHGEKLRGTSEGQVQGITVIEQASATAPVKAQHTPEQRWEVSRNDDSVHTRPTREVAVSSAGIPLDMYTRPTREALISPAVLAEMGAQGRKEQLDPRRARESTPARAEGREDRCTVIVGWNGELLPFWKLTDS